MNLLRTFYKLVLAPLHIVAALSLNVQAQPYKGEPINIYVGFTAGGGYDVYARALARFLGSHLPGAPNVIVQNMPGAGSLRAANYIYSLAPKDGTAVGTISRATVFDPLLGLPGAQFDATKYAWIGSANNEVGVCVAWRNTPVNSYDDLFTKDFIIGATGGSADSDQFPKIVNGVLGTRMKVVSGYPGGNEINLAMERGEVHGRCGWSWTSLKSTNMNSVRDGTIRVFLQISMERHPDLPDVPTVYEKAKTDEQRALLKLFLARQIMGRPFMAPPGTTPERVAMLRKAFMETMQDKNFLAEAERQQLEVSPVSGDDVQKLVSDVYALPAAVVLKAGELLK